MKRCSRAPGGAEEPPGLLLHTTPPPCYTTHNTARLILRAADLRGTVCAELLPDGERVVDGGHRAPALGWRGEEELVKTAENDRKTKLRLLR